MLDWPFRRKVRLVWWVLCTLVLASVPYTIWEFKQNGYSSHYVGWTISGVFVLLTIPVTVYQIALHLNYYNEPELQRHVVRIILMVPIYAMVSWLSLRWLSCRRWLEPLRECYEAVVLYSFYCYLISYLRLHTGSYDEWVAQLPPQHPQRPLNNRLGRMIGVKTIERGEDFMHAMRQGVLAYVFVRPCLALIQVACMITHNWGEGQFTLRTGWLWCNLTNNITQFWALYSLVAMYHATHHELTDIQPLRKFIIIKMVVFFSFWQGFVLSILGWFRLIGRDNWTTYQTKTLAHGIQDVIICMECLPAALVFAWAFPARDYMAPGQRASTMFHNVVDMFDIRDLGRDVAGLVDHQVTYASNMAAHGVVEVASAAHDFTRSPVNKLSKPIRDIARVCSSTSKMSGSVGSGPAYREDGYSLTPLLGSTQSSSGV